MGVRFLPSDRTGSFLGPALRRSVVGRASGRTESVKVDIALAGVPLLMWFGAGVAQSRPFESLAHLAIIGLLLIVPRAGMFALIPLLPFQHAMPFPPHGPIVAHALAISLSIFIRAAIGQVHVPRIARPAVWLAVALLAMTVFQATLGLRVFDQVLPLSVLSQLDQLVVIVMVFVGSVVFLRPSGVVPALVAYLGSYTAVSVIGILHFARPSVLRRLDILWMVSPDATRFRASGVIPNANFLGLFVAIGLAWLIAVIVWYVRAGRPVPVLFSLASSSAGMIAMLLSLSRAAIVATAVGVALATARASRGAALVLLVVGALVAMIAYPLFLDLRLSRTFGSAGQAGQAAQADSDDLRFNQAQAAVEAFIDAPVLGHGFGTFSVLSPGYSGQEVLTSAHNAYLKLAAEQGLLGLSLFVAFLTAIAHALWRAGLGPWSAGLAVVGVIAAFSMTGDTLSSAQAIAPGFAVLGAMLVSAAAGRDPLMGMSDRTDPAAEVS